MFLFYDDRIEMTCKNQSNLQLTVVLKLTSLIEAIEKRVKLNKKIRSIAKSLLFFSDNFRLINY